MFYKELSKYEWVILYEPFILFFKTWNGLFFTGDLRSLQSYLMLSLSVSDAHNPQHEYFTGDLNLLHAAKCKISIWDTSTYIIFSEIKTKNYL